MIFEFDGVSRIIFLRLDKIEYSNSSPQDASLLGFLYHISNKKIEDLTERIFGIGLEEERTTIEFQLNNFGYKNKTEVKPVKPTIIEIELYHNMKKYRAKAYVFEGEDKKEISYEELVNLWLMSCAKTKSEP